MSAAWNEIDQDLINLAFDMRNSDGAVQSAVINDGWYSRVLHLMNVPTWLAYADQVLHREWAYAEYLEVCDAYADAYTEYVFFREVTS